MDKKSEFGMKKRFAIPAIVIGGSLAAVQVQAMAGGGGSSMAMKATILALKIKGKSLGNADEFDAEVTKRRYPSSASISPAMQKSFSIRDETIDGFRVITLTPKVGASRWRIIYYHGGAYVNPLVGPHWSIIKALMRATGATITVPIYPLAPKFNNRTAFPFLQDVYRHVLTTTAPSNVVLAGDSAGGGLALGEAVEFRRLGLPMPARIIAFSPWLDLTLADPAARAVERHDVMLGIDALRLCGKWWAGGDDPRSPRLSPLYANLNGLPPIDIYHGTNDLLVVDTRSFVAKARQAGNDIHYSEYKGAFHVFVGATFTPEAKDVFKRVGASLAATPTNGSG